MAQQSCMQCIRSGSGTPHAASTNPSARPHLAEYAADNWPWDDGMTLVHPLIGLLYVRGDYWSKHAVTHTHTYTLTSSRALLFWARLDPKQRRLRNATAADKITACNDALLVRARRVALQTVASNCTALIAPVARWPERWSQVIIMPTNRGCVELILALRR